MNPLVAVGGMLNDLEHQAHAVLLGQIIEVGAMDLRRYDFGIRGGE
jgi:hypothetical protein